MTRAAIPGLASRHPLGDALPAMYAADSFAQRFTDGLDVVLAPIFATLDNLPAYFDPMLAPPDFLGWLGSWLAADLDPRWPLDLRREVVARAIEAHRWRGTPRGLVERLRLCARADARVHDGIGAVWSPEPGADLPGLRTTEAVVEVWPTGPEPLDRERVLDLVARATPLHLTTRVDFRDTAPEGTS